MRKLNDFIKRARQAKIHAYIIANLKDDMPKLFGKGRKKKELIKNLPALLKKIQVSNILSSAARFFSGGPPGFFTSYLFFSGGPPGCQLRPT